MSKRLTYLDRDTLADFDIRLLEGRGYIADFGGLPSQATMLTLDGGAEAIIDAEQEVVCLVSQEKAPILLQLLRWAEVDYPWDNGYREPEDGPEVDDDGLED